MFRALATLLVAAGFTAGCGGTTQPPTQPRPNTPTPVSLSISSPKAVLTIGESVQLRAVGTYTDGSTADVTSETSWRSDNETSCTVSASGLVSAGAAGTVNITGTWKSFSASTKLSAEKRSEPPPQYRFSARVHEPPLSSSRPIPGVKVEVSGGELSGQTFFTDTSGSVTLPPVAAPGFVVYFKKADYEDVRYEVIQFPRDLTPGIEMIPAAGAVTFRAAGVNVCTDFPTDCCGTDITTFPVYHSGLLVVKDLLNPAWGVPQLNVVTLALDGQHVGWCVAHPSTGQCSLQGGKRYMLTFSGDSIICRSYRIEVTHPR